MVNRDVYGPSGAYAGEVNPVDSTMQEKALNAKRSVYWTEPGLKIIRFRLLSDPGYPMWDVSYCWGMLGEEYVRVSLPFSQLRKQGFRGEIIRFAREDNLFVKDTGLFEVISTLC